MKLDVYFSIGSNIGDRKSNILKSLELMNQKFGSEYVSLSSIIETESWGFEAEPFLNCAVRYRLDFTIEDLENQSLELLRTIKSIESEMGRTGLPEFDENGKRLYESRIIDVDILMIGDYQVSLPDLIIPHPLMKEREFVMKPLSEILIDFDRDN